MGDGTHVSADMSLCPVAMSSRRLYAAWRRLCADPEKGKNGPAGAGRPSMAACPSRKGPVRFLSPSDHGSVTERCPAERLRPRRDCPLGGYLDPEVVMGMGPGSRGDPPSRACRRRGG